MEILILDDNKEIASAMKEMMELTNPSFEIVEKTKGTEALDYLKDNNIELFITDLNLSHDDLEGLDIIKEVAEKNMVNKIIVLTAYSENFNKEDVPLSTPLDIYDKPIFNIESFVEQIVSC